ncbi:LysR family transcriptional regulator [Achromobacter spanius]|uniref:LysR family transcriptional regulator n=1 Tax=Achromobacter spanius TaxID=217203 RepID=UPI003812781D
MNTHSSATSSISWARSLKIRHFEYFLVLESSTTLSEAAARLHMTQSAMSHWLNDLEATTGVRLLVRGRGIKLTPAGEALRSLAVRVLGDVTRTHTELEWLSAGSVASIRVGSVTAGLAYLLPRAICAFQADHESVPVHITEGPFNQLLSQLEGRDLDIVVGSMDARAYAMGLRHELLFEDRIVVITGNHHPLVRRSNLSWADLVGYRWIMPAGKTLMRTRLDTVLLEHGGAGILPVIETASVVTVESVLRRTNYVAICSASLGKHMHHLGLVTALPLSTGFGPVGAVFRDGELQPLVREFLGALHRAAATADEEPIDGRVSGG